MFTEPAFRSLQTRREPIVDQVDTSFPVALSGKSVFQGHPADLALVTSLPRDIGHRLYPHIPITCCSCGRRRGHARSTELVEISKLNGDFRRNYGKLVGAFLYLRSISVVRGRSFLWSGLLLAMCSAGVACLKQRGLP